MEEEEEKRKMERMAQSHIPGSDSTPGCKIQYNGQNLTEHNCFRHVLANPHYVLKIFALLALLSIFVFFFWERPSPTTNDRRLWVCVAVSRFRSPSLFWYKQQHC